MKIFKPKLRNYFLVHPGTLKSLQCSFTGRQLCKQLSIHHFTHGSFIFHVITFEYLTLKNMVFVRAVFILCTYLRRSLPIYEVK